MPGILYHLCFAEEVYSKLDLIKSIDKINFFAGNLIPDLAIDKQNSHYRKAASVEGFFIPDLKRVKQDLFDINDPIKFGMYSHLYLDYYFIEEFLIPEFIWDKENMKVINPRNNKEWDVKTFFSQSGLYGAYTEINQLLIDNGNVSTKTISEIPEILPNTGLPIFDNRREKTWREELNCYLTQKKKYTGDIFDYTRLTNHIKMIATQFVNEISS